MVFRGVCLLRTRPLLILTPAGSYVQLRYFFNMKFRSVQFRIECRRLRLAISILSQPLNLSATSQSSPNLNFSNATKPQPLLHQTYIVPQE